MDLLKLLVDTTRIDTVNLIPHSSHEPLHASVQLEYANKRTHAGAEWFHLWLFFMNLLRALRYSGSPMHDTTRGAVLLLAMSKNQEHSLRPIAEQLRAQIAAQLWTRQDVSRLWAWGSLISIPFLPCLLWRWGTSTGGME